MKTNADPRVDAYIAKSAPFARPILRHLRELVHQACPAAEETIKWSCPHFIHGGGILCSMAAFKAHTVFGFWHHGMEGVLGSAARNSEKAMGSFGRIETLADLPGDKAMLQFIREATKLNESDAPARAKAKPRPVLSVPADFAAALKKNPAAAVTFERLAPSHRREYIEWITEAKREQTRQKRLATSVEWLSEGKPRNWKYEAC